MDTSFFKCPGEALYCLDSEPHRSRPIQRARTRRCASSAPFRFLFWFPPETGGCISAAGGSRQSLLRDRERKIPLYAAAGVTEVWLLNLIERSLLRHSLPY